MGDVAIFFRKKVGNIDVTCNMANGNLVVGDRFTNSIFTDLDMSETLCSHVGRPENTGVVVIVDSGSIGAESGKE